MALTLEPAFTLTVEVGEPREVGRTHAGYRRVIPILGGSVDGPALTGTVLPGGADWNVVRPDGAVHVWARYEIRSADGAVISVINEGLGYFDTPAGGVSMPTRPVFEVPEGGPTWLATGFFLGELRVGSEAGQVSIEVSRVLAI
ncbi:DUF3237 family protein [Actinomadura rugatobispora]|uniref:UPF0311 protein ACFPZN_20130 n=1 Tax=Actinomadura rugatobispora TaxID=1994 RepID=A0ABW1A1S3_9ACTN|nr:hypothetical protein GCM10010200_111430 [Actinomadura rugatobispora]